MSNSMELKKVVVADIREKMEKAHSVVLVDYRGLTVAEVTELRRQCRERGVEYVVLKNTMVRLAAERPPRLVRVRGPREPRLALPVVAEARRLEARRLVQAVLVDHHPKQGLDAGDENSAFREQEFVVKRHLSVPHGNIFPFPLPNATRRSYKNPGIACQRYALKTAI